MKHGIIPKLTLVFVLFAAALLSGVGALAYTSGRASLQAAAVAELLSSALEKQSALDAWVTERQHVIDDIASHSHLREVVAAFLAAPPDSPEARLAQDDLIKDLEDWAGAGHLFAHLEVIEAASGRVVVATEAGQEGKFRESQPYFIYGRQAAYIQNPYYDLALGRPTMTAAAPVLSSDGRTLAVLAGPLNLDEMNAIVTRRTGLRQSDDAFLVNTSHLFVTQPRLVADPAVLQRGNYTEAVNRCLERSSGVAEELDYRGLPALVVYRWLPERQLCMIVKMDQAEAFAPSVALGWNIALIAGFSLLLASALAYALARTITRPLRLLQEGAAEIGQGNLDHRIQVRARDEVGRLAVAFNEMAANLSRSQSENARLYQETRAWAAELEKKVEERTAELREKEYILSEAQRVAHVGSWQYEIASDRVTWSEETYRIYGVSPQTFVPSADSLINLLHPEDRVVMGAWIGDCLAGKHPAGLDYHVPRPDGTLRILHGQGELEVDANGRPIRVLGTVQDITERKRAEQAVQMYAQELKRSNEELEQFAYVASHDLQEPLRMVTSYVQLLEKRYKGRLDADADEFIHFAVDGATRMKRLINDLLTYSRVGTRGKELSPANSQQVLENVLHSLQFAIEESGAKVTYDLLPVVLADDGQLAQLFQNLIGNAIKFHKEGVPPEVHISALTHPQTLSLSQSWERKGTGVGGEVAFSIRDNGIGFDPQYAQRIFIIFERLHTKSEYGGTGIGLAVCKKIVERHGGRIWVESAPGEGSTFYFTLRSVSSD